MKCCIICIEQHLPSLLPPTRSSSKVEFESATRRKERLEYEKWKNERRNVDLERIQRTKDDAGRWKREWDQHKPVIG